MLTLEGKRIFIVGDNFANHAIGQRPVIANRGYACEISNGMAFPIRNLAPV
jgi:hypothetical protein